MLRITEGRRQCTHCIALIEAVEALVQLVQLICTLVIKDLDEFVGSLAGSFGHGGDVYVAKTESQIDETLLTVCAGSNHCEGPSLSPDIHIAIRGFCRPAKRAGTHDQSRDRKQLGDVDRPLPENDTIDCYAAGNHVYR